MRRKWAKSCVQHGTFKSVTTTPLTIQKQSVRIFVLVIFQKQFRLMAVNHFENANRYPSTPFDGVCVSLHIGDADCHNFYFRTVSVFLSLSSFLDISFDEDTWLVMPLAFMAWITQTWKPYMDMSGGISGIGLSMCKQNHHACKTNHSFKLLLYLRWWVSFMAYRKPNPLMRLWDLSESVISSHVNPD